MRKIILIFVGVVLMLTFGNAKDTNTQYIKGCEEPYKEYMYYKQKAKNAINTDAKDRWLEIAHEFNKSYKKCASGVKSNIINKSNTYRTFKDD